MNYGLIGVMILCTSLLTGCSSIPKPPPSQPSHAYLPERFELTYFGIANTDHVTLKLENGYLVQQQSEPSYSRNAKRKIRYFTPSESDWQKFLLKMDELRVWEWKPEYNPENIGLVVDGGSGWSLTLQWKDKAVHSQGMNAWPKEGNTEKTALDDPGLLDALDLLQASKAGR